MNDSTFEMTEVNSSGRRAAAEPSEPLYEPPGYLPSSYQAVEEPVTLTPRFDDSTVGATLGSASAPGATASAPTAPSTPAPAAAMPAPAAPAPVAAPSTSIPAQPTVLTTGTLPAPEVAKYLQNLPAPSQDASQATPPPAPARPAPQPVATAADLSNLPAPAVGSAATPGIAQSTPPATSSSPAAPATPPPAPDAASQAAAQPAAPQAAAPQSTAPAAPQAAAPQPTEPAASQPTASASPQAAAPQASAQVPAPSAPPKATAPAEAARGGEGTTEDALQNLPGPVAVKSTPVETAETSTPQPRATPSASPAVSAPTSTDVFSAPRDASLTPDADLETALQAVLRTSGSDLHISAGAPPMTRVDGALRPIAGAPVWSVEKVSAALYSIVTPKQREAFEEKLEFDFAYTLSENARFRVNFYQQRGMLGAAFRLIPTEIKPLAALGVPDSIASFAKLPRGLVLVTGPTGSGKSTTLASLIDLANRTRTDHIMTVEDPIEFLHTNHKSLVNQREVGHDTESFASALKHVLRQDPDIILVGELRDLETISVALTAAETGHLVFATLHTQSAPQTIDRIIDVYPPHQQGQVRAQLASTLQGVVCQTLIKRANGKGRVVATEVLMATHAVANLIREGKTYQVHSAMQAGGDLGMHTLDQHLADLVNSGQISFAAAVDKAHDFEVLKRLVTRVDTTGVLGADMAGNGMNFSDAYSGVQY